MQELGGGSGPAEALYLRNRQIGFLAGFVALRLLLALDFLVPIIVGTPGPSFWPVYTLCHNLLSGLSFYLLALAVLMPVVTRSMNWKAPLGSVVDGTSGQSGPAAAEVVVPSFQLPVSANRQHELLTSRFALVRRWGFVAVVALAVAVPFAIEFVSGINETLANSLVAGLFSAIPAVLMAWLLSISERRYPARILFLRKFNNPDLAPAYRRIARRDLRPYGHLVGLGDRHLRRGWRSYFLGPFVDPYRLPLRLLAFPFVLVLRLFNRVRWGPPYIGKASEFRSFARMLGQRRWMNMQAQFAGLGYIVSTSDEWWQRVIRLLILSADVIVIDGSEVTSGTAWEIESIDALDYWQRTVVIARREQEQAARQALGKLRVMPTIWTYDAFGAFDDREGFHAAIERAVHVTTLQRWRLPEIEDLRVPRSLAPAA